MIPTDSKSSTSCTEDTITKEGDLSPSVDADEVDDSTPTVASISRSSVDTSTTDDEDETHRKESHQEDLDVDYLDVGFMFDTNTHVDMKRFEWTCRDALDRRDSVEGRRGDEDESALEGCGNARLIHVSVQCINDEPGAVQSGHYIWPGAQLMVRYLIQEQEQRQRPQPTSILELGAGCALASLAALQLYQTSLSCIVVTDHDPGTLVRARNNYESTLEDLLDAHSETEDDFNSMINDIASIPFFVQPLEWGELKKDPRTSPGAKKRSSETGDCVLIQEFLMEHTADSSDQVDLVLATDVLSCPEVVEPLFHTVVKFLKKPEVSLCPDEEKDSKLSSGSQYTPRFLLSQSFGTDDDSLESRVDRVCGELGLKREILWEGDGRQRVEEFRFDEKTGDDDTLEQD